MATHAVSGTLTKSPPDPCVWVELYGDYLYRYALFRLRDSSQAEDVVQETLLAAMQSSASYAGAGSERTWLIGIMKHKLIDQIRKSSRETPFSQYEDESSGLEEFFIREGEWEGHWASGAAPTEWDLSPESLVEQGEFRAALDDCLAELPPRLACAFVLREVEGLSCRELCRILDVSESNLYVMLHRARMQLRRGLEKRWINNCPRRTATHSPEHIAAECPGRQE